MKGYRPLTTDEVHMVRKSFRGVYVKGSEALLVLAVTYGVRISELLALRVRDVLEHGKITLHIRVSKGHMKGQMRAALSGSRLMLHRLSRRGLT
jgi:integrase